MPNLSKEEVSKLNEIIEVAGEHQDFVNGTDVAFLAGIIKKIAPVQKASSSKSESK